MQKKIKKQLLVKTYLSIGQCRISKCVLFTNCFKYMNNLFVHLWQYNNNSHFKINKYLILYRYELTILAHLLYFFIKLAYKRKYAVRIKIQSTFNLTYLK